MPLTSSAAHGNGIAFMGHLFHSGDWQVNTLNQETGNATLVTDLNWPPIGPEVDCPQEPRFNALDFNSAQTLFGSMNCGWWPDEPAPSNYLATINTTTGDVTVIGPTVDRLDGIAFWAEPEVEEPPEEFVPEPGTVMLLASGLMGLAGYAGLRRWKR